MPILNLQSVFSARTIWKVTSSEQLRKQAMEGKHLYRKYLHTHTTSQHSHCPN
jgi:hypothetical protein